MADVQAFASIRVGTPADHALRNRSAVSAVGHSSGRQFEFLDLFQVDVQGFVHGLVRPNTKLRVSDPLFL
jgi:hypothetical protein